MGMRVRNLLFQIELDMEQQRILIRSAEQDTVPTMKIL